MERKGKVTQAAVSAACDELLQAEKNVTVNAVINITGGSFSTVGAMVKAWKEEQAAQVAPAIEMPETVTQAMQKAAADIWGAASSLAGETVERIRKEAGEAIGKAKAELAEYTGEVTRLENELEQARDKAADTEKTLADTLAQVSQHTAKNAALETRLIDRDSELERLQANYEKLQAELIEIAKAKTSKSTPRK